MITYRIVIDATLEVGGGEDVAAACEAIAAHFQAIADGNQNTDALFDTGALTSVAPADDPGWT